MASLVEIKKKVVWIVKHITVEPYIFMYSISLFLNMPVLQALLYQKSCLQQFNSSICDSLDKNTSKIYVDQVQTMAAHWFIYLSVAGLVPSMFIGVLSGSWNDKIGRRYPMMMPAVGQILNMVSLTILSLPQYMETSMGWLLIGSTVSGLSGGFVTCITCVFSYVSTVSSPSNRVIRIAILEAMIMFSSALAVGLSGVFLNATSFMAVYLFIIADLVLMELYAIFFIKEPIPVKFDRNNKSWCAVLFNMDHVMGSMRCVAKKRSGHIRRNIWLSMVAFSFMLFVTVGPDEITYLFVRHDPVHWHKDVAQAYYGYYSAVGRVSAAVSMVTVLPVLRRCLHLQDKTIALIGMLSKLSGLLLLGFSRTTWMVFCVPVVGMFFGFTPACLRGILSKMVDTSEHGRLFSIVSIVEGLGVLVSSGLFNAVYPETLSFFPGFSFLFSAALVIVPCLLIITMKLPDNNTYDALENDTDKQSDIEIEKVKFDNIQ